MNSSREHLDAETVAAWIDGGLDTASLAAAEAHAADCDRCQALLATVTRTLPAGALPDARHHASGSAWLWKWLAPVAAAGAAVTLWMVVPQEPMRRPATTAVQQEAAPAPAPPTPAPEKPSAPPAAVTAAPQASVAPSQREERFADARRDANKSLEAKAARAEVQPGGADTGALRERQEKASTSVAAAPPPAPAEPAREVAAPAAAIGAVAGLRKQTAPLEFVSPDPAYRWRVVAGTAEYSQDAGQTWVPVAIAAGGSLTAGSSPAPRVCWLVGRGGLVLLSTDGVNFTRLPFPEPVDLAAVTAFDSVRAIVTTADGRTFETRDNGKTWRNP